MKFTIEIKKIKENSDCSIANLKIYHKECHGGRIELEKASEYVEKKKYITLVTTWHLNCTNCGAHVYILSDPSAIKILDTAIDGKERKIGEDITIVQIQ